MAKVMASQKMDVLPYCTKDIHTFYFAYCISLYHCIILPSAKERFSKRMRREKKSSVGNSFFGLFQLKSAYITVFVVRWIPFSLEIHNVHFDQNKNCTQSVAK